MGWERQIYYNLIFFIKVTENQKQRRKYLPLNINKKSKLLTFAVSVVMLCSSRSLLINYKCSLHEKWDDFKNEVIWP